MSLEQYWTDTCCFNVAQIWAEKQCDKGKGTYVLHVKEFSTTAELCWQDEIAAISSITGWTEHSIFF